MRNIQNLNHQWNHEKLMDEQQNKEKLKLNSHII